MIPLILLAICSFGAGFFVGVVAADFIVKKPEADSLDLNKDGKVDIKDLEVAKAQLKKTSAQVTKLAKKVK